MPPFCNLWPKSAWPFAHWNQIDSDYQTVAVAEASIIAVKIAGDKTSLNLVLESATARGIRGLCLFVTGNESSALIQVGVPLDGIVFYGRGNQTVGQINVIAGGHIAGLYADLKGNQATLVVTGGQADLCTASKLKGNKTQLICQ